MPKTENKASRRLQSKLCKKDVETKLPNFRGLTLFQPVLSCWENEKASINFFNPGITLKIKSVKATKNIKVQNTSARRFNERASGINTRTPKNHIKKADKRLQFSKVNLKRSAETKQEH